LIQVDSSSDPKRRSTYRRSKHQTVHPETSKLRSPENKQQSSSKNRQSTYRSAESPPQLSKNLLFNGDYSTVPSRLRSNANESSRRRSKASPIPIPASTPSSALTDSTNSPNSAPHSPSLPHSDQEDSSPVVPPKPLTHVGDYVIKRDIGHGTFGVVKLAEHKETGLQVAVKVIEKQTIKGSRAKARVEQELRLLPLLNHPHIVKVYDVVEDEDRYMIVMEYLTGGELFRYIVKNRRINEREGRYFFRQLISALDYCHTNSIIHRDLKPENVLLDSKMQVRLIDFGFANFYHPDQLQSTFCGSPYYASPEMVRGVDYIGPEVDVWSLGVTLYTMLSGKLPFSANNLKSFQRKIVKGDYEIPVYFSKEVSQLVQRMLTVDPRKRLSLAKVRGHSWTNLGYPDLPNSYLTLRPPQVRNPNSEILKSMSEYGFEPETSKVTLLTHPNQSSCPHPIVSLYHLLNEKKTRLQDGLVPTKPESTAKKHLSIVFNTSSDSNTSSQDKPPLERADTEKIGTSRRFSAETMTSPIFNEVSEEDHEDPEQATVSDSIFTADLPLSKTPLTGAGRSFDSISRRNSLQYKLRPIPPKPDQLIKEANSNENQSTHSSEEGTSPPDRTSKDGWFSGLFNVSATSTKAYHQIVQELDRVMDQFEITYQETSSGNFTCDSKQHKLQFEVRIVWKSQPNSYSVQFKNVKGSPWAHKKVCSKLIQRMYI
jgi:serine/threonine protein kinase